MGKLESVKEAVSNAEHQIAIAETMARGLGSEVADVVNTIERLS